MSRVVYLHIGAPKTGTTYLQDRLMRNVDSLAAHGVSLPSKNRFVDIDRFHFRAALDLLEQDWGGDPGHAKGAWGTMVRRIERAEPKVIVSHEVLAPAEPARIAKAMNDLAGNEIHIVYSARDLGRQLPAAWQEAIKQGRKPTFSRFLDSTEGGLTWFARALDLPKVLAQWGAKLPPENIHVVTVPHDRGPGGNELWLRFCRAFDIDPAWAPLDSERVNPSLGIAETHVIRRLNRRLRLGGEREYVYDDLIREILAQQVLANRETHAVRLPPQRYEWAEQQAELWIEWLEGSGVDVVGDPADLRPRWPDADLEWHNPDRVPARDQLDVALDALAVMTHEAARRTPARTLGDKVRHQNRRMRER